jgi:putative endonuclease
MAGYTYIMSNEWRSTLYIGVTIDIEQRVLQHKSGVGGVFSSTYRTFDLMWYREFETNIEAIHEEKRLKNWKREWKLQLIWNNNPRMVDLVHSWFTKEEIRKAGPYFRKLYGKV